MRKIKRKIGPREFWVYKDSYFDQNAKPFETGIQKLFNRIVQPGWTVFDVGANIGIHTVLLCKLAGKAGKVVALEPVNYNQALLYDNLHLNDQWAHVMQAAASDKPGHIRLNMMRGSSSYHTNSSTVQNEKMEKFKDHIVETYAQTVTLDSLIDLKPDFIKIDTEGAEFKVLSGAKKIIQEYQPTIIMEYYQRRIKHLGLKDAHFAKILSPYYYAFEIIDNNNKVRLRRFDFNRKIEHNNILCVSR